MDAASMSSIASASSSEVAVMAERGLRRAATAPVADRYNLTPPPEIHTPGRSRTNRFVVDSRQMEQILRNRHLSAPDLSTTVDNDSSTESEQTLTPISRDDREETQAQVPPPPEPLASVGWRRFVNGLLALSLFQATTETSPQVKGQEEGRRVKHKKLEDYPRGTAQFSHFLNSNDSFCIFRKFGNEGALLLLRKELELENLSTKLDELNKTDAEGEFKWRLTTLEHDDNWDPTLHDLLNTFEVKLAAYHDALLRYTEIRALPSVSERNHESVQNWVLGNGPLNRGQDTFLENRDDFVSARKTPETKNKVEEIVERYAAWDPDSYVNGWLGSQEDKTKEMPENAKAVHLSPMSFEVLSKICAALLALGLVLAPVLILFLANLGRQKMAVVVGVFDVIYLFGAALVMNLSTQDIFVYLVAYSAILVTLLSNFLQINGSGGSPQ